jgi:hypothetical protein
MPYYGIELDQIPRFPAEEVIRKRCITVAQVKAVPSDGELPLRVFVEMTQRETPTNLRTRAAYADMRPSKHYPRVRVGAVCRIRTADTGNSGPFTVEARAYAHDGQLGGETFAKTYEEAKTLALSFIEYAGHWLDSHWFEEAPESAGLSSEDKTGSALEHFLPIDETDPKELKDAKEFLNDCSLRMMMKAADSLHLESIPTVGSITNEMPESGLLPLEAETSVVGSEVSSVAADNLLTTADRNSLWKRLCQEARGLCRIHGRNFECSNSETELVLRQLAPARVVRVSVVASEILADSASGRQILQIVKTPKGNLMFEGTERIPSIPRLAQWLMRSVIGNQVQ